MDKEERKEKKWKKREGKANKGEREESDREREREKQKGRFSRHSDGLRVEVDPRIAGYVWVPKSKSFVKLREVRNFSYFDYF